MSASASGAAPPGRSKQSPTLPPIPAKRYFSIGEVSELCAVPASALRYWEREFVQLRPAKRSGNRRFYQQDELLLIRQIRSLLYEQGFTIQGARLQLAQLEELRPAARVSAPEGATSGNASSDDWLRAELLAIRTMLE